MHTYPAAGYLKMDGREILIIDEDESQSGLLRGILDGAGYEVAVIATVDAALSQIRPDWPDLLLLATTLTGQDGSTLIRSIREDDHLKELPIIVLGARMTRMDALAALESGADDYIAKPFGQLELVARVRSMLRRRCSTRKEEQTGLSARNDVFPCKTTP
jgi:two-component system alkaline phosphatase synthesis response regulator PhoP